MAVVTIPPANVTVDMTPRTDFLVGALYMDGITPIMDALSTQVLRNPNTFINDSTTNKYTDLLKIRVKKSQNIFL